MENKIKQIFSKNLVTVCESDSVADAEALMRRLSIRHLPVTDKEGYLVGLLSKSDYLAMLHLSIDLSSFKVKELMSHPVKTFSINAPVRSVAQTFVAQKINSALVMDKGEISGIVTSEDLLRLLAEKEETELDLDAIDLGALASDGWISATALR
jgi:CBS domain-containing protein